MSAPTSAQSWLAVAGGAVALFCTVGFMNAFGVFQEYYSSTYLRGRSASDISWIGSISVFLLYLVAPIGGMVVDKFGPTAPLCVGSVVLLLSVFMTSLCSQYWQLILAQGILLGVGASLIFSPPLGVVSRHMPQRRGMAMGLVVGGSSIGGVVWPIVLQQLLDKDAVSFGWSIRAVGFIMVPFLAFACLTVVEPPPSPPSPPPAEASQEGDISPPPAEASQEGDIEAKQSSASTSSNSIQSDDKAPSAEAEKQATASPSATAFLRRPSYLVLILGLALAYLGLFTPLFYLSEYAVARGQSASTAFYLLSAVNASSFFGRVVPGLLADRYGHYNILILSTLLTGVVGFTWAQVTHLAGLIVWSLAFGFCSGATLSLPSACAGKTAGPSRQGLAVGFLMGCISVSLLIGTPISGQILAHSGYLALSMWTGATLVVGACVIAVSRFLATASILSVY